MEEISAEFKETIEILSTIFRNWNTFMSDVHLRKLIVFIAKKLDIFIFSKLIRKKKVDSKGLAVMKRDLQELWIHQIFGRYFQKALNLFPK
jgi:hypothetical protein